MAYCTVDDVKEEFPSVPFTAQTKVTLASITNHITGADAIINSYLAGRYVTPVTGTESLKVLNAYSRALVADKIKGLLEIKQQTNTSGNQNVRSGLTSGQVMKALEGLRDGDSHLTDADLLLEDGGISSFNVREARETRFATDRDDW